MNSNVLTISLNKMRFSVYRRIFESEGIEVNQEWLRERVFSGVADDLIKSTVYLEADELRKRRWLNYWAHQGFRAFRKGWAVRSVRK